MNSLINPFKQPLIKLSSDLTLLFLSLIISIAAITSVGFFTAQVDASFEAQASDLLAADVRINAHNVIPPSIQENANKLGLKTATIVEMPTMLMTESGDMELVALKAISASYPLRSELKITSSLVKNNHSGCSSPEQPKYLHPCSQEVVARAPNLGSIYLSKRIAKKLKISLHDQVSLGYQKFSVAGFIAKEPDKVGNVFQFAPKVMINTDDLPATKLITEGSRVNYRLLLAGNKQALQKVRRSVNLLCKECKVETVKDARPQIKKTLDKAADFLQLAALVSIILAGAAMVMSVQQYAQNQVRNSVIKRSMGATMNSVLQQEIVLLTQLTIMATIVGSSIGYFGSQYIQYLLGSLINLDTVAVVKPIISGALTALIMVLGFTLPTLMALKKVPVVQVLKQQNNKLTFSSWSVLLISLVALFLILIWNSQDKALASYLYAFVILAMASIYSLVWLIAWLLSLTKWIKQPQFVGWKMAMVLFIKRKQKNAIQITALAIGVLVVVILGLLQGDILTQWQSSLSGSSANMFLVNVQTDDVLAIQKKLKNESIHAKFSPMVRARLIKLNNQVIDPNNYQSAQAKRILNREFNLSYSDKLPKGNKIEQGDWWQKGDAPQLSFEKGMAKTLGIKLGDNLTFDIAGKTVTVNVSNIRSLKWQSFDVNFFVMGNNGWMDKYPKTWVSSFYLSDAQLTLVNEIVTDYPHITALDIKAIMSQIESIINKVSEALEFVFMFTLMSALLVLFAAANATKKQRKKEIALQKVFGASQKQVTQSLLLEYAMIAFLAVLPACVFALIFSHYLAVNVFLLPSYFDVTVLVLYVPPAILIIVLSGWYANKKVIQQLPIGALNHVN